MAIEIVDFPIKMVIFLCYVSLPEGKFSCWNIMIMAAKIPYFSWPKFGSPSRMHHEANELGLKNKTFPPHMLHHASTCFHMCASALGFLKMWCAKIKLLSSFSRQILQLQFLVGGFNMFQPLWKILHMDIYGNIKNVPNHQPDLLDFIGTDLQTHYGTRPPTWLN